MEDATMIDQPEGTIAVLNVAEGDLKVSFDPANADEAKKAKTMVVEMIKNGYAVMVKDGNEYVRVKKFDPDKGVYVIGDKDKKKKGREIPATKAKAVGIAPRAGG